MIRRAFLGLCLLAAAAIPLPGCDKNKSPAGAKRVAVIPKGTSHVFWKSVEAGAKKAGSEFGLEIVWKGPVRENDSKQQIQLVEQFTTEGVAGIVVAPLDATELARPIREATAAKVPVLIFDSGLNATAGKDFISFVATDNRKGGRLAGEELARLLGGKGKVVLLRYAEGSASTNEREAGFLEVMERHPGITVISKDRYSGDTVGTAQQAAETMIDKLREADGIFTPNESSTLGMVNALKGNGLAGQKKFVGFDATPQLLSALRANEVQALVAQNPTRMGYEAVKVMAMHLKGEKYEQSVDTGCELVTLKTINEPQVKAVLGE
jgi:ribose transport system substrate-binding protein